ncbi:hypothetical protein G5I_04838 [Acromyrmex echinatior]|uniref:Uncharacterized protein n=1 Tax=Acromyrmex echinatior TaxID=103372 RepID=F4WGP8_ACREC|nr:hypothetical protein G5I_04838 [Acromyrmex echinatior]
MSDEINVLLSSQRHIHDRMARSITNLKKLGTANITHHTVESRLALLDQMWAKFEKQHDLLQVHYKDAFDESEYNTSQFVDSVDNTYVQQRGLLNEYLTKLKVKEPSSASKTEEVQLYNVAKNVDDLPESGSICKVDKKDDKKIVNLFSRNPGLTLRQGQARLTQKGLDISYETIRTSRLIT